VRNFNSLAWFCRVLRTPNLLKPSFAAKDVIL
jgi:hypothetical protein